MKNNDHRIYLSAIEFYDHRLFLRQLELSWVVGRGAGAVCDGGNGRSNLPLETALDSQCKKGGRMLNVAGN